MSAVEPAEGYILAVIDGHSNTGRVLRAAKRRAEETGLKWEAIFLEPPSYIAFKNEDSLEQQLQNLSLAQHMGVPVIQLQAANAVDAIEKLVGDYNNTGKPVKKVFVGDQKPTSWLAWLDTPFVKRVRKRLGGNIKVIAVNLGEEEIQNQHRLARIFKVDLKEIGWSAFAVLVATLVILAIQYISPGAIGSHHRNKSIIFMIACAFAASRYGLLAGIVASVLSFLSLSLFFTTPYFRIVIENISDAVNLGLFISAAVVISLFGSREHNLRQAITRRATRLQSLLRLHRVTLDKNNPMEAIKILDDEVTKLIGTQVAFFLPSPDNPGVLEPAMGKNIELSKSDSDAMSRCWLENKVTGRGASCGRECNWRFEPLLTSQSEIGVLGANVHDLKSIDVFFARLLSDIAGQAALILERLQLGQVAEENKIQAERENLRAMLLSSVSHDLKTPLASIIGSLSVVRGMKNISIEQKGELIETALEEAQRLDSFITNILDMTRIESGQIEMKEEWIRPQDIMRSLKKRMQERLSRHHVTFADKDENVEVLMDNVLIGQVLQNILDNAIKYTPPKTAIEVSWYMLEKEFFFEVRDHGPGIPEDQLHKVFDKYARIKKQDSKIAGTGLGLAIAKAVVEAQNGNITVTNHPLGGAVFSIRLPRWRNANVQEVA